MRRHRQVPIRRGAAAALAAGAITVAGCSEDGQSDPAGTDRQQRFEEAALKHAECMRANGVDVPDPKPGRGGLILRAGPDSAPDPALERRAFEACEKHLEDVPPPQVSDERRNEMRDAALDHARCMREQGIDFPDPQFGEDGRIEVQIGEGFDPRDPAVSRAQKACARYAPRLGGPGMEAP